MSRLFRLQQASVVLIASLSLASPCLSQQRIVVVGDVHGAYTDFVAILQQTKLIDDHRQWIGGSAVLVQTGDVLDRGPRVRECLDLLMELERQAAEHGGKVVALLGNHEIMTVLGDARYVAAGDYQSFAAPQSAERREREFREYREFVGAHNHGRHPTLPADEGDLHAKWMAEHPLGFFERWDALGREGVYGRWIRAHDAIVRIGDGLFTHGGLNPTLPVSDIRELNDRTRTEIADFDLLWESLSGKGIIWKYMTMQEAVLWVQEEWAAVQLRGLVEDQAAAKDMLNLLGLSNWFLNSPDSPIWYRGLALQPEENLKASLADTLNRLKASYLVAGHTVRPKFEITPRFDNRVFLIDTGMLREVYGGRASALEIANGRFTAYYSQEKPRELATPPLKIAVTDGPQEASRKQDK